MVDSPLVYHEAEKVDAVVFKTLLLLSSALSVHLSLSPPNPAVKRDECCSRKDNTNSFFEKSVQSITFCSKTMVWIGVLAEIWVPAICALSTSPLLGSTGSQGAHGGGASNWTMHPVLMLGVILTIMAALLRMWCFKTLGPFFTFEITIRPSHELITSGPYTWVRHPSYTGVYCTLLGASLVLVAPRTWFSDHGIRTLPGAIMAVLWCVKCAFAFRGTSLRLHAEDQVLKETFGEEWEEYAERVPWKLLPGVI